MSVRIYDPKTPEIFGEALCSQGCGKPYYSICRFCNLAYCFEHLKKSPHACDTKREYIVLTPEEVLELFSDPETPQAIEPEKKDPPESHMPRNGEAK